MITITIMQAIQSLRPNAECVVLSNDIIDWHDKVQTQPSQADIDTEVIRLQTEYDALDYARKREAEYPSVQDLVVALYDTEDKASIDTKRAEIKLKYPKPI